MRTLPEHTVDCWVAVAVKHTLPSALVWAPTQVNTGNWDMAVRGLRKLFLLENKACENDSSARGGSRHVIGLDIPQLRRWSTPSATRPPVYYVLPVPPWTATPPANPGPVMPDQALCQLPSTACGNCGGVHPNGFADWAWVVEAGALVLSLVSLKAPATLGGTFQHEAAALVDHLLATVPPIGGAVGAPAAPGVVSLKTFLDDVASCARVDVTEPAPAAETSALDRALESAAGGRLEHVDGRLLAVMLPWRVAIPH